MDHYASLGVSRTSEDVVIRAAYLALMRRYHPDGNPSPEAADRVRAITAAYDVLGNEASRRDYDRGLGLAPERSRPPPAKGRRAGPLAFVITILCLAGLVWLSARSAPGPNKTEATTRTAAPRQSAALPEPLTCLSPEAGEMSRQAVLRQANDLRQGDRRILTLAPGAVSVRTAPALSMAGRIGGALECAASVNVLLPRGLVTSDGAPSLHGEAEFLMASDAQGAAELVDLALDDRFLMALASVRRLAPVERAAPEPERKGARPVAMREPEASVVAAVKGKGHAEPREQAKATPRPCSGAACADGNVRELDQQLAIFERQSLANADGRRRAALRESRARFEARRAKCATMACARGAILDQTVEVAEIMRSRGAAPAQ